MVHIITDANFNDEVLKSDVPVLVDFWAPWCGPCQLMGPIIEALAHEYEGKAIKIGKCNVDENPNSSQQYGVLSIPTFLIFKNGQVVDTLVGGTQKEKMKEFIEKNIGA